MDYKSIELAARDVLGKIYRKEESIHPGALHPMQMLEPEVVAEFLSLRLEYADGLGKWRSGNADFEIAGLLDQQRRLIRVSTKFPYEVQRFTAAHEIGHVVLNHPGTVIHRDRPAFNLSSEGGRDRTEREADYFAACLLAPRRLLIEEYQKRFLIGPPLPLNDDVAFNLCGESAHALMRAGRDSMKFALTVASARRFNGRDFRSLADTFNMSVSAMAIRLRELGLIEE